MNRPEPPFAFRRLTEDDLPLLHRWLNTAHVLEWWDRPGPTLGQVQAKYLPRVTGASDVTSYVIYRGEVPIGYIQLYPVRTGAWGLHSIGAGEGLDLFIGEALYVHRGLGAGILRQFLTDVVFRDAAVNVCFVDPSPRNRGALRAYEKAGFRYLGTGTDPDSGMPVHLMEINRHDLVN
ncbi:MAG TPA: GNAT family N-acetyltransferase [bacterium]|nr:GNAT family N-acetyltransferase [bacterium]